jgi:hypothetical protein
MAAAAAAAEAAHALALLHGKQPLFYKDGCRQKQCTACNPMNLLKQGNIQHYATYAAAAAAAAGAYV